MFGEPRQDLIRKIPEKTSQRLPTAETLESKLIKAYARMKLRADERKRKHRTGATNGSPSFATRYLLSANPFPTPHEELLVNSGARLRDHSG
jgi:hypothetical protein